MANDEISDISEGGVALGENKFKESQLLDVAIKAGEVVNMTATGIKLHHLVPDFLGVMKEHEEFDLDTDITAAKHGDVVTEGYVAVFVEAAGSIRYPGRFLYKGMNGCFGFIEDGPAMAVLERTIAADDTVAIVKLLR